MEEASDRLPFLRYQRGRLEILNQTKLPHRIEYVRIQYSVNAREEIGRIRSVPAIAMAVFLSVAVSISNIKNYQGTSDDASSLIATKLDTLVSSFPELEYVADEATKLKATVSLTASSGKAPPDVFEAYLEAVDYKLQEDATIHKAIASNGAHLLHLRVNDPNQCYVLTQCNIGSLATGGYATALGIIPSLNELGVLKRAYFIETTPFYLDSTLQPLQRVHENIPATLIQESSAASLMKQGCVNSVIVAVDRIAENGDILNKIGTYSLALCANYHHIPFYVVAPVACIDFSCATGAQFLTRNLDPLAPQAASSGVIFWRPAFDVTPADLIDGIITEKGVIVKDENEDVFDLRASLQGADSPPDSTTPV